MSSNNRKSIIIVGTVRNVSNKILKSVKTLNKAYSNTSDIYWFVVESDSADSTLEKLDFLEKNIPNFYYKSLGNLRSHFKKRTDRLAICRNACIDFVAEWSTKTQADYVIVADLDGVCNKLTEKSVDYCWPTKHWDVITSNSYYYYYDLWALRKKKWIEGDCFQEFRDALNAGMPYASSYRNSILAKMKKVIPDEENQYLEVESAFGGIAVYKLHVFLSATYELNSNSNFEICEHVAFHNKLKLQNYRIAINSCFLSGDAKKYYFKALIKYFSLFPIDIFFALKTWLLRFLDSK